MGCSADDSPFSAKVAIAVNDLASFVDNKPDDPAFFINFKVSEPLILSRSRAVIFDASICGPVNNSPASDDLKKGLTAKDCASYKSNRLGPPVFSY